MRRTIILAAVVFSSVGWGFANEEQVSEWLYPHLLSEKILRHCGELATPPVLKGVEFKSSVVLDGDRGKYTYRYILKNGSQSTGCLEDIEIDILKPTGSTELLDYGLKDYPRHIFKDDTKYPGAPDEIPVAFPDLPRKTFSSIGEVTIWDAGISGRGTATWGVSLEQFIPPGEEVTGFILTSYGLPSIRGFTAGPRYLAKYEDMMKKFGVTKKQILGDQAKYLESFYDSIAFKGKTIGPTAPPADFKPLQFLDYIISMKHEAASLGWIKNKGVENSLDAKLENARKKIEQGNVKAVKNILGAFINEVEAQGCESYADCPGGKHLKPEAYALLKYNARYLIDNLK